MNINRRIEVLEAFEAKRADLTKRVMNIQHSLGSEVSVPIMMKSVPTHATAVWNIDEQRWVRLKYLDEVITLS